VFHLDFQRQRAGKNRVRSAAAAVHEKTMSRDVSATEDVAEEPMADKARGQVVPQPSDALMTAIEAVKR
jgi:hypothetical protein